MRLITITLLAVVLLPFTVLAEWKKPYFGATPPGSWATYATKASVGAPSVTTSTRLDDRNGRVRLEDRNSYPGKEYPPSTQRYELAAGFDVARDLIDFPASLATYASSTNGGPFQPMAPSIIKTMKEAATRYGPIVVFVKTEAIDGKTSDHYTYTVHNQAAGQTESGDLWLSDAVPFGLVKRTSSSKDASGKVVWSMEQTLTDFGATPKVTPPPAKAAAPKAAAPAKKPAPKKAP
jgi:hypothetical protein